MNETQSNRFIHFIFVERNGTVMFTTKRFHRVLFEIKLPQIEAETLKEF